MAKTLKCVVIQSSDNELPNQGINRNVTLRPLNPDGSRDNSRTISLGIQNPGPEDVYPLHTEYDLTIAPVVTKSKSTK